MQEVVGRAGITAEINLEYTGNITYEAQSIESDFTFIQRLAKQNTRKDSHNSGVVYVFTLSSVLSGFVVIELLKTIHVTNICLRAQNNQQKIW